MCIHAYIYYIYIWSYIYIYIYTCMHTYIYIYIFICSCSGMVWPHDRQPDWTDTQPALIAEMRALAGLDTTLQQKTLEQNELQLAGLATTPEQKAVAASGPDTTPQHLALAATWQDTTPQQKALPPTELATTPHQRHSHPATEPATTPQQNALPATELATTPQQNAFQLAELATTQEQKAPPAINQSATLQHLLALAATGPDATLPPVATEPAGTALQQKADTRPQQTDTTQKALHLAELATTPEQKAVAATGLHTTPQHLALAATGQDTTLQQKALPPTELASTPQQKALRATEAATTPEQKALPPTELATTPEQKAHPPTELATTPQQKALPVTEIATTPQQNALPATELATTPEQKAPAATLDTTLQHQDTEQLHPGQQRQADIVMLVDTPPLDSKGTKPGTSEASKGKPDQEPKRNPSWFTGSRHSKRAADDLDAPASSKYKDGTYWKPRPYRDWLSAAFLNKPLTSVTVLQGCAATSNRMPKAKSQPAKQPRSFMLTKLRGVPRAAYR